MTNEQTLALLERYKKKIKIIGEHLAVEPTRADYDLTVPSAASPERVALSHALFMCSEIERLIGLNEISKANRWLGFVQGIFWAMGVYTINDMRKHNMPAEGG